jgi:hypothetical protein
MPDSLVHPRQNVAVDRRSIATNNTCDSAH